MVRANELTEEVVVVGRLAVDGVEVFDDVVRFVVCVGMFYDLTPGGVVCVMEVIALFPTGQTLLMFRRS